MSFRVFGFSVRRDRREAFRRTEEAAIEMGINVLIAEHEAKSGSIFSIVLGDTVSDDEARRYVERVAVARKAS